MHCHGYRDDHGACCCFKCFYHCADQCELFWRYDGFGYCNGRWWHSSLYVQLEYDACSNNGNGYEPCCWHLYGDDYRCRRMHYHGYGDDHGACCCPCCQHYGYYECELFWRYDGLRYCNGYGGNGALYLQLEYNAGTDGCYCY